MSELVFGVSDFVAVFNQTIEYAYPSVAVVGEISNLRVSKNRWVYFDLKDENASVKFFGTVYQLPGPLEDGLMVQVTGTPRLHSLYGFSITVQSIRPVGEGSLKRAAALLESKLRSEGLFDESRKRELPYPPQRIGLVTSGESAAYYDFIKILEERWAGVDIVLVDAQVQGERAPKQLISALDHFNTKESTVDVIVITRGGGSTEDLAVFNDEQLTRAVAVSRIPTLVAVGHEIDISLAELAADKRASTPSNAAQLLVPDKRSVIENIQQVKVLLGDYLQTNMNDSLTGLESSVLAITQMVSQSVRNVGYELDSRRQVLFALSPQATLKRGYVTVVKNNRTLRSSKDLKADDTIEIKFYDGNVVARIV